MNKPLLECMSMRFCLKLKVILPGEDDSFEFYGED